MRFGLMYVFIGFFLIGIMACGTVGKRFDSSQVKNIKQGTTNKSDILEIFGLPFKEGEQNGNTSWTYEYNEYSAFGRGQYEDFVILFDSKDVVQSYRYTTSAPSH